MRGNQGEQRGRNVGRPNSYTHETHIQFSHTHTNACGDGTNAGLLAAISKGQRVITVHTGSENGFIPNALLMFVLGTKSVIISHEMNLVTMEDSSERT
jgi:hypothetical protein